MFITLLPLLDAAGWLCYILTADPTWWSSNRKHQQKAMNQYLIVIYYNGRANYALFVLFIDPGGLTLHAFESHSRADGKSY